MSNKEAEDPKKLIEIEEYVDDSRSPEIWKIREREAKQANKKLDKLLKKA